MTVVLFLAEWALRSSILIAGGAVLLWLLRVKDPSVRLAAWTAMLCGSLAIPVLTATLPRMPLRVMRAAPVQVEMVFSEVDSPAVSAPAVPAAPAPVRRFDWPAAAAAVYALAALALLLRVGIGLLMSLRLLRGSRTTGRATEGIEIRDSDGVKTPVTLGVIRPAIVLPADWSEWDSRKLEAVLAHERSHVRRFDPAVQLLSAIHRALLWHSPASWFLHRRVVRVAEEASDDAAVAVTRDRAWYAAVLLEFLQAPVGVPMARYGRPDHRIERILDSTILSRGVTRWSVAAILAIGAPLAYLAAAAQPQSAPPEQAASPARSAPTAPQPAKTPAQTEPGAGYLAGIGSVTPSATVLVRPRIDGQLMSVNFKEGETVQAGQLLATIDPGSSEFSITQAQAQLDQDAAALRNVQLTFDRIKELVRVGSVNSIELNEPTAQVAQLQAKVQADQAGIDRARLLMSYTRVVAPISGVTGLRKVDPGNMVRASDDTGIVVLTQLQPIAVIFTIPEDNLARVMAQLKAGVGQTVEAWDRTASHRLATGRLAAVDNQIDPQTGTAKLKAEFENKDGALFPGQFVNVRLFVR